MRIQRPREGRLGSHTFSAQLDLPDYVMEHPVVEGLGEAANDLVTVREAYFGRCGPGTCADRACFLF